LEQQKIGLMNFHIDLVDLDHYLGNKLSKILSKTSLGPIHASPTGHKFCLLMEDPIKVTMLGLTSPQLNIIGGEQQITSLTKIVKLLFSMVLIQQILCKEG
jgi:hypothetical protein